MAKITNYGSLKTAVSDYLARADLTSYIDGFIQMAEMEIYRDPDLRVRAFETAFDTKIGGNGKAPLPTGYQELKHVYLNTEPAVALERVSAEYIYEKYGLRSPDAGGYGYYTAASIGKPKFISREGNNFIFGPYPNDTYRIKGIYYKRPDALSDDTDTNWFITNAPDLMLYRALLEAEPFIKEDRRISIWRDYYNRARDAVKMQEKREQFSGSSLSMRAI